MPTMAILVLLPGMNGAGYGRTRGAEVDVEDTLERARLLHGDGLEDGDLASRMLSCYKACRLA